MKLFLGWCLFCKLQLQIFDSIGHISNFLVMFFNALLKWSDFSWQLKAFCFLFLELILELVYFSLILSLSCGKFIFGIHIFSLHFHFLSSLCFKFLFPHFYLALVLLPYIADLSAFPFYFLLLLLLYLGELTAIFLFVLKKLSFLCLGEGAKPRFPKNAEDV